ncbi:serine-protein kinase ATM-like [Hetaerina americana]|uniref:serine-protein kinase ATM-like n=1 Tax=Hetaerina americana TaxID=62018 RepID=UPI003A7F5505
MKVFPYWGAYNCIKDFYLENAGVIFTTLWMANHESLDEFCHIIEKNISEVFKEHSALLLALSMSQYLCSGNEDEVAVGRQTAQSVIDQMLKEKKAELRYLYDEIEEKSDSFEKYSGSVLHRTICLLAKLCTTSDQVIRTEAAKCLAELGPGYLRAPVLVPEITVSTARSLHKNQLHKLTLKCLELLPMYLLDPSMEVVEVTSTALMAIINSKEGQATLRGEWPCQLKLAEDYTILEKNFSIKICLSPLEFNEMAFFETHGLWIPSGDCSHSKWIVALVTALLRCFTSVSSYLEKLIKICSLKVSLCEEIFPFILEIFLHCGQVSCQLTLFERIRHFFKVTYHSFTSKTDRCSLNGEPLIRNKATVVTMLNVVNYLNLQHHGTQVKDSGMNEVDAIDYLHCAVAAQQCSAYFSAIQYCTLWLSQVSKGNESNNLSFHLDVGTPHVDEILLVLRKCHAGLGDTDGLYGCGTVHLLEPVGRIEHFKNLEKWEEVMRYYELELSDSDDKSAVEGLLISMQMLGMEELLMGLLETREQEDMLSYKYECGWRLCSWDLLSKFSEKKGHTSARFLLEGIPKLKTRFQIDEKKMNVEFHRNLFLAIRSVQNGKYADSLNQLVDARECVVDLVSLASLEACQNIYCPITRLHALKMIEEFTSSFEVSKESALKYILSEWKHIESIRVNSFEKVEPHKALSLTLLKSCFFERNGNMSALNMDESPAISMAEIQLQLGCSAREAGMYSISEKYLRAVRKIPGLELKPSMLIRLQFEEAQLLWAKGYADIAKVLMHSVVDIVDKLPMDESLARCHAAALTLQGHWVMKTHSKGAKDTLSKYFGHAEDLLNEYKVERNSQEYLNAVRAMAEYADEQYVLTSKYINSSSYAKKQQCASHSMHIVSDFEGANRVTSDERRSIMLLEKQAELDEKELEECKADKTSYMEIALSHYIKFLIYSPKIELEIVFRFVSLFLESYSNEESIFAEIERIPSYKFIRVVPQLLPRIVLSKGNCSRILKSILEKSALHHPHHVLPHILALAYSLKDLEKGKSSDAFITETQKANQKAAKQMVEKLRKNPTLTEYVKELSSLWEALISLAYSPVNAKQLENTMGAKVALMKLTNLSHVQVPTVKLPESPIGEYNSITSVWKYLPTYTLVGGINVPKKITCQGSDGNNYPQLLKGRDDLRQDAVMQQVFDLINCLLRKDKNAWRGRLRIRTYGVVPLSHRSGIIEWCNNTISIGNYLHGVKNIIGAHSKFNPSDYPIRTCRSMMMDVQKSTKKIKLQVYLEICENLQPVFRHYFFSKFPNPGIWYEMRQSYTRSVATSSIIGYVLGLGDRHVQNILIDESTAEVLHVDLGIAFEQGKTLNTPESVPFRLTRDIVDGMGICGIEGVFKKSCEVTMALMRKYYQIILTVVEVLIYDPLYVWTLKPKYKMLGVDNKGGPVSGGTLAMMPSGDRVAAAFPTTVTHSMSSSSVEPSAKLRTSKGSSRASTSTSGQANLIKTDDSLQNVERNPIAMRAMERLEQKLMGTENGPPASSVKAQVERLIQEAQDPENLCILYPGWQPYL